MPRTLLGTEWAWSTQGQTCKAWGARTWSEQLSPWSHESTAASPELGKPMRQRQCLPIDPSRWWVAIHSVIRELETWQWRIQTHQDRKLWSEYCPYTAQREASRTCRIWEVNILRARLFPSLVCAYENRSKAQSSNWFGSTYFLLA